MTPEIRRSSSRRPVSPSSAGEASGTNPADARTAHVIDLHAWARERAARDAAARDASPAPAGDVTGRALALAVADQIFIRDEAIAIVVGRFTDPAFARRSAKWWTRRFLEEEARLRDDILDEAVQLAAERARRMATPVKLPPAPKRDAKRGPKGARRGERRGES